MQYILFVLRFFSFLLFLQKKEQKTKTKTHKQTKAHTKVNIESIFFYSKNSIFKIKKNAYYLTVFDVCSFRWYLWHDLSHQVSINTSIMAFKKITYILRWALVYVSYKVHLDLSQLFICPLNWHVILWNV